MAGKISFRQKRREAPQWIFRWGSTGEPMLPKLLAVGLVAAGFSLAFAGMRIRVGSGNALGEIEKKSAWIMDIPGDEDGSLFSWVAVQEGPFPSRWEPFTWKSSAAEGSHLAALDWRPARYEPSARNLPEIDSPVLGKLAPGGELMFPKSPTSHQGPRSSNSAPKLRPMLRSLGSGMELSSPLPAWDQQVEPKLHGASVRFLLNLDAQGRVCEVLSMADVQDSPTMIVLDRWLRACRFTPTDAEVGPQWLAVMIEFESTQTDGSHP